MYPIIRNRIQKQAIIAGKVFSLTVPLDTFQDTEDGNNLRLELFDSHGNPLKNNSWIQFNAETREIYGLPLEKDVSKWHYILQATDSGDKSVNETVDISVQQHKSHRSVNHEISLALKLQRKFARNVDWQIEIIRGITKVLGDASVSNVVVREVRNSIQDPNLATFVYTNETLPKDRCPEEMLDELVAQLTEKVLNDVLNPDIMVKSVQGQQIGQCMKSVIPKVKPTQSIVTKNFAPTTRNQVDRVNATVGHLLVYKVPADSFYDPEDENDLKLKLLTTERNPLDQHHWLQFDSKNQEFFGVPQTQDVGHKEYLLIAEDREGLTATDALVVVVHQPHYKRDYSVLFELTLDTTLEQFSTAQSQRRFIERLAMVFGDSNTNYIQIRKIHPMRHVDQVQVTFFNTTLYRQHQRCPDEEIEALRNMLLYQDGTVRTKVRDILGQEFNLVNMSMIPMGTCQGFDTPIHVTNEPEKAVPPPIAKDDYLLTVVLPAVIILAMLLIAFIIACILYRRRLTGKMELGTDEERKSFRSKGIPVIFQDELDEKPEIGNKSPVILKDEKPPLLPPSYSSTNNDGENEDVDEYVPPPAVVMGGRESRGKSPVTPSYRRPPPYVSP
ncbi:AAEL013147-PA [Aedes aegypti]|nr:AAEL013147-PA [Aedes aegypti]